MTHSEVLKMVDHTLLAQTATWEEIRQICDDGLRYGTASVCIPPCYVAAAAEYVQGKLPICTVIGFPNGNHTTEAKIYEAKDAIANGASAVSYTHLDVYKRQTLISPFFPAFLRASTAPSAIVSFAEKIPFRSG